MKNFIGSAAKWLGTSKLLSAPRIALGGCLERYYTSKGKMMINLADFLSETRGRELTKQIKSETDMRIADQEAYTIYVTIKKTEKIEGEVAEVGVYKGGSAKLACEATKKPIHLFDTFEGLPDLCEKDDPEQFYKGKYCSSFEGVKSYLASYPQAHLYKGFFPDTAGPVIDKKFSFVHLDVDIYQSTLDCLKFFYPRMSRGGVIISHDYTGAPGVKKAFDEFFEDKPEIVQVPLATWQCLVVKV